MADAARLFIGSPWPGCLVADTGGVSFGNNGIDASNDKLEFVFQADEAVTITHLGFRYGVRTGTPPVYRISLQGVTNGESSGTVLGGGSPASATFTPPADATWNGTWQWVALTNSYTCARGDLLAIVIDYSSGTIDGTNFSSFTYTSGLGKPSSRQTFPKALTTNAGAKTRSLELPIYAYKSATTVYGTPLEAGAQGTYSSGSTPDEKAMKFTLPAGWGDTFQVVGVRAMITVPFDNTVTFVLYDTDGTTALQSLAFAAANFYSSDLTSTGRNAEIYFDEASLSNLAFGSTYRLAIRPDGASTAVAVQELQVDAAADWAAWPGGTHFGYSERTNAGAWTDDATKRLVMDLIVKDWTEPAGGGGTVFVANGAQPFGHMRAF